MFTFLQAKIYIHSATTYDNPGKTAYNGKPKQDILQGKARLFNILFTVQKLVYSLTNEGNSSKTIYRTKLITLLPCILY